MQRPPRWALPAWCRCSRPKGGHGAADRGQVDEHHAAGQQLDLISRSADAVSVTFLGHAGNVARFLNRAKHSPISAPVSSC